MRGSIRRAPMESARWASPPDRMTAGSGSARMAPSPPEGAWRTGASAEAVAGSAKTRAPAPVMTRALRPGPSGARAGVHTDASTRSPSTLTHWAWQSAGSALWAIPGASFTPTRSKLLRHRHTADRGGDHCSGSAMRRDPPPAPVRRAGSAKTASTPWPRRSAMSSSVTSPRRTPASSKCRRLMAAAAAASWSRSTARIRRPRPATNEAPASRKRRAWWAATTRRVACSRPSRVKTMESA